MNHNIFHLFALGPRPKRMVIKSVFSCVTYFNTAADFLTIINDVVLMSNRPRRLTQWPISLTAALKLQSKHLTLLDSILV